jgi:hypothetical protein
MMTGTMRADIRNTLRQWRHLKARGAKTSRRHDRDTCLVANRMKRFGRLFPKGQYRRRHASLPARTIFSQ